jgi:sodium-dependent dicarboxylate transporter 2/3/5
MQQHPPVTVEEGTAEGHRPWRWWAIAAGPLMGLSVWATLGGAFHGGVNLAGLSDPACRAAGVAVLMAVWWLTEAIPLTATALLPLALFPLLNIQSMKDTSAPYGDEVVFLFLGGFLIQLAMERWGLHRRVALLIILAVGTRPVRLVGGLMLSSAVISMWVSNAATTAMMLPIAMSVCRMVLDQSGEGEAEHAGNPLHSKDPNVRNFGIAALIGVAYAATIGGVATPVGTAPNMLLVSALRDKYAMTLSFPQWMALGLPLASALLVITWFMLTRVVFPIRLAALPGGREGISRQLAELGPMKRGEALTLAVFLATAACWVLKDLLVDRFGLSTPRPDGGRTAWLTDGGIAIAGALTLFLIPVDARKQVFVLDWKNAARLPFGVLLLFGGGLSLASAISATKIDAALGQALHGFGLRHELLLMIIVTVACVWISELVSNTALTAAMLPVLGSAAAAMGVPPLLLLLPATLGASLAFMMPAGTPPNAIAFSSGYFRIGHMAKAGFWLNWISIALIVVTVWLIGPMVMPVKG